MIIPMTTTYAKQIAGWTYKSEYAVYNFKNNSETLDELMNGEYYACLDPDETLTGYFCFGQSARIPTVEKDVYPDDALDMGLGMRPDLCGKGFGYTFVKDGLEFAQRKFAPGRIRLSVAVFNLRAIRTYKKLGFRYVSSITHSLSRKLFTIMVYPYDAKSGRHP
ncbi:MAG: GNAT family N-acetyltransferase [Clostridiales bacterium]|nr:GNAT family N-acetyltransferase [Clostridiales bacterium]